jgi:hypothetical protein
VRPIVAQMVEQRRAHAAALERQEELEGHIRGNGGGIPPATLAEAAAEVDREGAPSPGSSTSSASSASR